MELFDVSFGDSYERRSIGLALSMDGARMLARAFLAANRADAEAYGRDRADRCWFEVTPRQVGEISDLWYIDESRLTL